MECRTVIPFKFSRVATAISVITGRISATPFVFLILVDMANLDVPRCSADPSCGAFVCSMPMPKDAARPLVGLLFSQGGLDECHG